MIYIESLLIYIRYIDWNENEFVVIKTTIFSRFTVLHINYDFDDDLLMDTIELLV